MRSYGCSGLLVVSGYICTKRVALDECRNPFGTCDWANCLSNAPNPEFYAYLHQLLGALSNENEDACSVEALMNRNICNTKLHFHGSFLKLDEDSCGEEYLKMIDFFLGELQASRMLALRVQEPEDNHSSPSAQIRACCTGLQVEAEPSLMALKEALMQMHEKEGTLDSIPPPLLPSRALLTPQESELLHAGAQTLYKEYNLRNVMMRERLDVTIDSMLWADHLGEEERSSARWEAGIWRALLQSEVQIATTKLFNAKPHTLQVKRSIAGLRSRLPLPSQVLKVDVGKMPDRGGRYAGQSARPLHKQLPQPKNAGQVASAVEDPDNGASRMPKKPRHNRKPQTNP